MSLISEKNNAFLGTTILGPIYWNLITGQVHDERVAPFLDRFACGVEVWPSLYPPSPAAGSDPAAAGSLPAAASSLPAAASSLPAACLELERLPSSRLEFQLPRVFQ